MNVLLLTDFSSGARHAHQYALNLFANKKVNYFLLHANYEISKLNTSNDQHLENEITKYKNWGLNSSKFTIVNSSNSLIDAIRNMMKKHVIDLVVMGATGNSQKTNNSLGNNTKSTATKIKCPVLIVFQKSIIKLPLNVAFPVDYTDKLKVSCIDKLKTLPNSPEFLIEVFEINAGNSGSLSSKNTRNNLRKGLDQLIINFKRGYDFNINDIETNDKKHFDLISFAAKNLRVCHIVFNQLNNLNNTLSNQPPLYILHD